MSGTARPKKEFMAHYCDWTCTIMFRPQQKWDYESISSGHKYRVSRDNVSVIFSKEEFEEHFKVVEE